MSGHVGPSDGGPLKFIESTGDRPSEDQPCRIVVDASDMTSGDRVLELFDRGRVALRSGLGRVQIDLRGVTAADTKIIACLVALHQIARTASVRLEVGLSKAVEDIAGVCRLERLLQEIAAGHGAPRSR